MGSLNVSKNGRVSFSHIEELLEIPDLLAIQTKAYQQFLQEYEAPEARKDLGLQGVLNSVFPISWPIPKNGIHKQMKNTNDKT